MNNDLLVLCYPAENLTAMASAEKYTVFAPAVFVIGRTLLTQQQHARELSLASVCKSGD